MAQTRGSGGGKENEINFAMKILLLQDIPKLGRKGDIVDVSGGYAKNALIPRHLAEYADEQAIRKWKSDKEREEREKRIRTDAMRQLVPKLHGQEFQFQITVGKNGELFNSLHEETIRERIANFCTRENGLIRLEDVHVQTKPIKQLGKIKIPVRLGRGEDMFQTEVTIELLPEADLNR